MIKKEGSCGFGHTLGEICKTFECGRKSGHGRDKVSLSELRRMANMPILQHEGQPVWFCNVFFPLKGRLFTRFCPLEANHKETVLWSVHWKGHL